MQPFTSTPLVRVTERRGDRLQTACPLPYGQLSTAVHRHVFYAPSSSSGPQTDLLTSGLLGPTAGTLTLRGNWSAAARRGASARVNFPAAAGVSGGAHTASLVLTAENVALWWPNTYGDQPRYELTATFTAASAKDKEGERGKSSSSISTSRLIGFRTVAFVNRMFSANGTDNGFTGKPRQFFQVNGVDIFVRGANFVTVDVLESRVTTERYRHLLQSAR